MATSARSNEKANVLGSFTVAIGPIPSSLELEILACGVDVISADRVKRYQEQQVQIFRAKAGWWGKHASLAFGLVNAGMLVLVSSIIGLVCGWFLMGIWTLLLLAPATVSFFLLGHSAPGTKMGNAMAHWMPLCFSEYHGEVPAQITAIVMRVSTIPETNVIVEYFQDDPFVFLERGAKERCCIGYWDAPGFEVFP